MKKILDFYLMTATVMICGATISCNQSDYNKT
jgi:hypothetical protein